MTTGEHIERVAYSPMECARACGLSLNHVYDLIRLGIIPSVRLGKRILIPRVELEKILSGNNTDVS